MGPFKDDWTEADVNEVVQKGNVEELLYVPVIVGMNADVCDREWAENICYKLAVYPDDTVRGNAALGLGHIARTCQEINLDIAIPLIRKLLSDRNQYVRSQAATVVDDFRIYLKVDIL